MKLIMLIRGDVFVTGVNEVVVQYTYIYIHTHALGHRLKILFRVKISKNVLKLGHFSLSIYGKAIC